MLWLILTISAYFFGSLTHLFDKYLLKKSVSNPVVLSFYVGFSGIIVLLLSPFGIKFYPFEGILLSLLVGFLFILATYLLFYSIKKIEVSRAASFIGGLTPIFILIFAFLFLGECLTYLEIFAFLIIITGSFLISLELKSKKFDAKIILVMLLSALLFGLSHSLSKYIYLQQGFINGFIWIRIGSFLFAALLLTSPSSRAEIIKDWKKPKQTRAIVFLSGQAFGALSLILLNYAFIFGPIALISALQGTQYAFLFLIVSLLTWKFPSIIKEKLTTKILLQKIISIVLIAIGLGMLSAPK